MKYKMVNYSNILDKLGVVNSLMKDIHRELDDDVEFNKLYEVFRDCVVRVLIIQSSENLTKDMCERLITDLMK